MKIDVSHDSFPLKSAFRISRGSKTTADVVTVKLTRNGVQGWGECVPYARYGETVESVIEQLQSCLLYTSPSPRDLSTSRMPSSA